MSCVFMRVEHAGDEDVAVTDWMFLISFSGRKEKEEMIHPGI